MTRAARRAKRLSSAGAHGQTAMPVGQAQKVTETVPARSLRRARWLKRVARVGSAIAMVFALARGVSAFRPDVSVTAASPSLDESELFSTPIKVTNLGNLPVHVLSVAAEGLRGRISFKVHLDEKGKVTSNDKVLLGPTPGTMSIKMRLPPKKPTSAVNPPFVLRQNESHTIKLDADLPNTESASMTIVVPYKQDWWPFKSEKRQRFIVRKSARGTLYWYEVARDDGISQ